MEHLISIIIPTLNEELFLPKLLEDLSRQEDKRFEVIIIDGKSTDKTREKALAFSDRLSLRFIEAPKAHLASQRNLGGEKATTEYLFFVDADTGVPPNVIGRLLNYISSEKSLLYLPSIKPNNPTLTNRFLVNFTVASVKLLKKINKPLSIGPLIVINKKLFQKIGGFSEITSASEDHNLIIKAHQEGTEAKILDDVICYFSMRRFDSQGAWKIVWQYGIFTAETILKGGVYDRSIKYEMGGQEYDNFKKD